MKDKPDISLSASEKIRQQALELAIKLHVDHVGNISARANTRVVVMTARIFQDFIETGEYTCRRLEPKEVEVPISVH